MRVSTLCILAACLLANELTAATLSIGYLEYKAPRPPVLSNVIAPAEDEGLQGALLGIADNNTTGRFLKQTFELSEFVTDDKLVALAQAKIWLASGMPYLVVRGDTQLTLQITQLARPSGTLVFNAGSKSDALRQQDCQVNLFHTMRSYAMLTDALGQWLLARKLRRWLLVHGDKWADKQYSQAIERSAQRYGATIVDKKQWHFKTDLRRQAQAEVPLFTQTEEYDVVVVADELGDFGEFIPYNTWYPRPVVGTQGLVPKAWHKVIEQWGAAQLQKRFEDQAQRWMQEADYAAWLAVRTIGEAAARLNSLNPSDINEYLGSASFSLGGFKGRRLSYRPWSGQLRQPIPLLQPMALVSQSPQAGYLHPITDLDTLGFDESEVHCIR